jgi:GntR family transcriptional regulator
MANENRLKNTPLSDQVQDIIIRLIKDGTYPPGNQLPPENELAARFDVSRATIRRAMSKLSARGLIVQKHGVGTFVSRISKISNPLNEAVEFNDLISRFGYHPAVVFHSMKESQADQELASTFNLRKGDPVFQTEKIFTADGSPVIYVVNCIPTNLFGEDLANRLVKSPEITEPLYEFFENQLGRRIEYHIASISAVSGLEGNFSDLALDEKTPLLRIEETAYDEDEMALWHSLEYFPQNGQMMFNVIRIRT